MGAMIPLVLDSTAADWLVTGSNGGRSRTSRAARALVFAGCGGGPKNIRLEIESS